jgi:co-chaperonin GroES (HSP10)
MPGHVFVQHVEPVEQRSGLVLPPQIHREEGRTGVVVAVGSDSQQYSRRLKRLVTVSMTLSPGQYVLFKKHTADVFSIKGQTFYAVREADCLLVAPDLATFQQLTVPTA